jgi:hypothetical protein
MKVNRRKFLGMTAAASTAFTIVPRHVLGGQGVVAPSDKITVGYIGCGMQGLDELQNMLKIPEMQVVAVCDPNKLSNNYVDFLEPGIAWGSAKFSDVRRVRLSEFLGKPDWRKGTPGLIGGRDIGKEVVETYYGQQSGTGSFKGVNAYADFRELLAKEDIDAVKIMTPDHFHAYIAIAAMKKGKHVQVHKPLANRLREGRLVFETARQTGVATWFLAWRGRIDSTVKLIDDGAIGTLREIHCWANRPVWPQYQELPTDKPAIPAGLDWDLWLGPEQYRPYSPKYTNCLFRGWFDFGGGAMADAGIYIMMPIFFGLNLPSPVSAVAYPDHTYKVHGTDALYAAPVQNDFSFPHACAYRFKLPAANGRPSINFFWYDGGMLPPLPQELEEDGKELPPVQGSMFIGDKGKILDGRLIPESKAKAYGQAPQAEGRGQGAGQGQSRGAGQAAARPARTSAWDEWIKACKGGPKPDGNFLNAIAVTDLHNLGTIALRTRSKIEFDPVAVRITNNEAANKFLTREYRKGWEL